MKIRIIKLLKIEFLMLIAITFIIQNFVYADGGISFGDAASFISKGAEQAGQDNIDLGPVGNQFSDIAKILTYVGAGILVAITAYMGIKYMTAPPEQQAKLKEQLIGLVVSAIVIFGAYFIWSTIYGLLDSAFSTSSAT